MKTFHKILLFLSCLLGAVVLMQIALAAHTILTSAGATSFTQLNEDVYAIYNVSVNNTDAKIAANANISYVNITIPSTFTLVGFSNLTSAGNHGFSNTSTVLSWFNTTTGLVSNVTFFFRFNASAANPGIYNISIVTLNQTGSYQTNLTITINDTTVPSSIAFADPSRTAGTNISTGILLLNFSASDNGVFSNITINLYNATGVRINQTNSSATEVSTASLSFSFTGLADGNYTVNATAYDNYNNSNSSVSRVFYMDSAAPSAVITCTPSSVNTGGVVTCSCTGSDTFSGVANTSFTVNPSTAQTGTFTTSCTATDYASNQGSGSFQYTVEGGRTAAGGGGSSTETWTTFARDTTELSTQGSVESKIGARQRIRLKVGGETHHVGVKSITATSAVIEVTSTPQEATFAVGESKKFDVNSDNYYDMSVTLTSIEASKANVVILAINEAVPASEASSGAATTDAAASQAASNEGSTARSSSWIWVLVVIVVVIVVIFFVVRARKN